MKKERWSSVGSEDAAIKYDTLENGKIIPLDLPGTIKYVPIASEDAALRRNFTKSMNADINDGDINSSRDFGKDKMEQSMYNSPEKPEFIRDSKQVSQKWHTTPRKEQL